MSTDNKQTGDSEELKKAVQTLCNALREDTSEGSYYYAWQSNIAMAFVDKVNSIEKLNSMSPGYLAFVNINKVANDAAKEFLNLLIKNETS